MTTLEMFKAETRRISEAREIVSGIDLRGNIVDEVATTAVTIGLAWTLAHPEVFKAGRTFIHVSEPLTGELIEINSDVATLDFAKERKQYPIRELASSFAVKLAAEKIQFYRSSEVTLARVDAESISIVTG